MPPKVAMMMSQLQIDGRNAIREIADAHQLAPTELLPSRNGTQFDNYLPRTVFTVYHKRLDAENISGLEVAVSTSNIAAELGIKPQKTEEWFFGLSQRLPTAKSKEPENWPRVAIRNERDVRIFCDAINLAYQLSDNSADQFVVAPLVAIKNLETRDEITNQQRLTRRGQAEFRLFLLEVYSRTCAISGCRDREALEAAHIIPHAENEDYDVSNGILLRADLHRLFDRRLISIDPRSGAVAVSSRLSSMYSVFKGKRATLPHVPNLQPSPASLMHHFQAWAAGEDSAD